MGLGDMENDVRNVLAAMKAEIGEEKRRKRNRIWIWMIY